MIERSVKLAIINIRKCYDDALANIIVGGETDDDCFATREAAQVALTALPVLDSRQACSEYIGCIAWMCARKMITMDEAKMHLYTAQTALSAITPTYQRKNESWDAPTKKGKPNASKPRKS